jgi:hypothetical protein
VLANDTDSDGELNTGSVAITIPPQHGSASVNGDGTVTYTPQTGFTGSDSLAYTVQDDQGGASAPATLHITVTAAPVPPASSGGGSGTGGGGELNEVVVALLALLVYRTRMRSGKYLGPNRIDWQNLRKPLMTREVMEVHSQIRSLF